MHSMPAPAHFHPSFSLALRHKVDLDLRKQKTPSKFQLVVIELRLVIKYKEPKS